MQLQVCYTWNPLQTPYCALSMKIIHAKAMLSEKFSLDIMQMMPQSSNQKTSQLHFLLLCQVSIHWDWWFELTTIVVCMIIGHVYQKRRPFRRDRLPSFNQRQVVSRYNQRKQSWIRTTMWINRVNTDERLDFVSACLKYPLRLTPKSQ